MTNCCLCQSQASLFYKTTHPFEALYYRCDVCDLKFLDSQFYYNSTNERSRYENHQNHLRTKGYEDFLLSCIRPIEDKLTADLLGLDFGCGPYPMLCEIMKDKNISMDYFDPLFFPDTKIKEKYDFVTCTEVIEHFNNPHESWDKLTSFLKKDSYLCLMTSFYDESIKFSSWYYRVDPTHVCFYSHKTLVWLSEHYQLELIYKSHNCAIFNSKIDQ